MQNQEAAEYSHVSEALFSANANVRYMVVVNMFGEVTRYFAKSSSPSQEEISGRFQKIAFAINALAFENVKFMMVNKDDLIILMINLGEDTLVIGIDKNAPWSDISSIIGRLSS